MKKEFFIASIGTELDDISIKVIKTIKLCDCVVSDVLDYKTLTQIKQINNNIKIECLPSKVSKDINKRSNYIIKRIKALFKKHNKIMLLTMGNPFFLNRLMIKIHDSTKNKYKTTVIPSVSFFDYVIDAIIKEITNEIMYVVYTYPTNNIDINKNCVIFNPDIFKNDRNNLIKLDRKIPKKHPFYTIKINKNKTKGYEIRKFKFEKFIDIVKTLDNETTIFIPALKK